MCCAERCKAAQDRQKSNADTDMKADGVRDCEQRGELCSRSPVERGRTAETSSRVEHSSPYLSELKKCYADKPLVMPLEGIHVDDKLQFVEEPVEIIEREIKRLKRSRIPLVKVRWNSKAGP
ncbi:hypothetical protein Tco_0974218 [Tanacetum coccineum]|uniref:Reverse transcriptase domain-containing protein n=1 Tax=Tanacetum coccineum TaxID=301880 RepID=A0ABQ5EAZ5_9ASTR